MSNEFCPPLALSIAPRGYLAAALCALHGLPLLMLPLLSPTGGGWALALAGIAALSLAALLFALRAQRPAGGAVELHGNAAGNWLLYRDAGPSLPVQFIDAVDLRWFIVLLMAQRSDGRRFRVLVRNSAQPKEQLHRLRVLRTSLAGGG